MVYLLYNFILILSAIFLVPYYLLRGLRYGKSRRGIRERLGYYSPEDLRKLRDRRTLWIHAVSVGETRAAIPLLKKLRKEYPDHLLVLSNVTETGHAIAGEISEVDLCIFFPFDFSWAVRKALNIIAPDLIVIVETEIWPNFCRQAHYQSIPLVLVNGRISDRSFPHYRYARFFIKPVLNCFSGFCMQSQADAERIASLGASSDLVENTGNLKFDLEIKDISEQEIIRRKQSFRLPENSHVIVAGSTHDGEEQQLLEAFSNICRQCERPPRLVLIPRHPERKKDVASLIGQRGLNCRYRSALVNSDPPLEMHEILVVDTLGEVLDFYSVASIVFVGGSLVPVGGHNLLEAALLAKPVLFGNHVHNFKEISKKLIRSGGGIKVADRHEFEAQAMVMLKDPVRCQAMGEAGRSLITENAGATERTMRVLNKVMFRACQD